jgi:hypothetical protein
MIWRSFMGAENSIMIHFLDNDPVSQKSGYPMGMNIAS